MLRWMSVCILEPAESRFRNILFLQNHSIASYPPRHLLHVPPTLTIWELANIFITGAGRDYSPCRDRVSNRNMDLFPSHHPLPNIHCIISLKRSGFCLVGFADLVKENLNTKLLQQLVKSMTHLLWVIWDTSFFFSLQNSFALVCQCFILKFFCLLLGDLSLHRVAFNTKLWP